MRLNTRGSSLVMDGDRFVVTTDGETFTARSVIVATGTYHRAYIPAFASALSPCPGEVCHIDSPAMRVNRLLFWASVAIRAGALTFTYAALWWVRLQS